MGMSYWACVITDNGHIRWTFGEGIRRTPGGAITSMQQQNLYTGAFLKLSNIFFYDLTEKIKS